MDFGNMVLSIKYPNYYCNNEFWHLLSHEYYEMEHGRVNEDVCQRKNRLQTRTPLPGSRSVSPSSTKKLPGSARTASSFPWFLCQCNINHTGNPESNDDFQVKPKHDLGVVPDDAQPVAVSASFDLMPDLGMNTGHGCVQHRPVIL